MTKYMYINIINLTKRDIYSFELSIHVVIKCSGVANNW